MFGPYIARQKLAAASGCSGALECTACRPDRGGLQAGGLFRNKLAGKRLPGACSGTKQAGGLFRCTNSRYKVNFASHTGCFTNFTVKSRSSFTAALFYSVYRALQCILLCFTVFTIVYSSFYSTLQPILQCRKRRTCLPFYSFYSFYSQPSECTERARTPGARAFRIRAGPYQAN